MAQSVRCFYGNFNDLLIGLYGTTEILVDPYTDFVKGTTGVRALHGSKRLSVVPGMMAVERHEHLTGEKAGNDWWMGEVIHCGGAARDQSIHNLFQIADVDSDMIRWVNADLMTHILPEGSRAIKNSALGGASEHSVGRSIAIHQRHYWLRPAD